MKQVNALIRITRLKKGIKAAALAHECNITASYLSQIESGKEVDPAITSKILRQLGIEIKKNNRQVQKYDRMMDDLIHAAAYYDQARVKELIDQNLAENELRQQELEQKIFSMSTAERETLTGIRLQRALTRCEEASDLIVQIEREFDAVEKRYNRLIEQKTIFASRAAARIRYLLQEGDRREDKTLQLVNLLSRSDKKEEIIQDLAEKIQVTSPFRVITEKSLYTRRDSDKEAFAPAAVQKPVEEPENGLEEFVLKPLYTHREIDRFRRQHMKHGVFEADSKDIQSVEDLEKLFFVWQEATELAEGKQKIEVGEELISQGETGFKFSRLTIEEKN